MVRLPHSKGTFKIGNRRKNMFINYSLRIVYTYLSKPFHATIGIRQGGVLSPYLLDVY